MTNKSPKPVKQCEGCALNQGDRCLAFPYPASKWAHEHECEGFNNEDLIAKYRLKHDEFGAHARKEIRREKAKNSETIEHVEAHGKFKKLKWP